MHVAAGIVAKEGKGVQRDKDKCRYPAVANNLVVFHYCAILVGGVDIRVKGAHVGQIAVAFRII